MSAKAFLVELKLLKFDSAYLQICAALRDFPGSSWAWAFIWSARLKFIFFPNMKRYWNPFSVVKKSIVYYGSKWLMCITKIIYEKKNQMLQLQW